MKIVGKNDTTAGILAQTFPFIEAAIKQHSLRESTYMTHELIVKALLDDPHSRHILEQRSLADKSKAKGWLPIRFAGNYIAFYSRDWTIGRPSHADGIERQKVKGKWAYRDAKLSAATSDGKKAVRHTENEAFNLDENDEDADWLKQPKYKGK